ncbi:MAG: Usg family protein [Sphaerospermopsis sp. SIO1G2]|nr:Usg family protein [Sphaerospermopsis sp. SIO1G2]
MVDIAQMIMLDYRLTTAEIFYHMPDHPSILQSYIWQELDLMPEFPELKRFLEFWDKSLEGKLHSVTVASCEEICPSSYLGRPASLKLH